MDKKTLALLKDKKAVKEQGLFIVDTEKILKEAMEAGIEIERFFYSDDEILRGFSVPHNLAEKTKYSDISRFASVKTHSGFLALCRAPEKPLKDFKSARRIVLLDGIQDPSNIGAIIRSGAAFGFEDYLLINGCAGIFSEKAVRASAGAVFKVNTRAIDIKEAAGLASDYKFMATDVENGTDIKSADISGKTVIVFGSEGKGVSREIKELAASRIKINYPGNVESLNVAAAAAVIFFEFSSR